MHLFWNIKSQPLAEVAATLEIIKPPTEPWLYFWALQASFRAGPRPLGAGHMGLQHHPSYPGSGAVNWGGYHHGGGELPGSHSPLGSTLGNPNTSNYRWQPGVQYRYRIHPSPQGGWRATITDLSTGIDTAIRDLWVEADHLTDPMVWSEVFAPCDAEPVVVEWSDLEAQTTDGRRLAASGVRANFQTVNDGGCSNTNATVMENNGGKAIRQITNAARTLDAGATIAV